MKHFYIKIFFVFAFIISFAFNVFSQTATTTINYSGFQACGGCAVCGSDYWCTNTPGSYCGDTPPMIVKSFFDPVPSGSIVTSVTVNYWTASCEGAAIYGTFATSSTTSFVFPVAYDGNGGCLCSNNPCELTTSSSVSYPCGIPGYVYGGTNYFNLSSSGPMCINRAELVFTYYPANLINPTITASGPLVICAGGGNVVLTANNGFSAYHWSTGSSSQAITVSSPGTYTVTVTSSSGCNTLTASATVVAGVSPVASASSGDYCEGETGTIAALPAGMTYNWSGPGGMTGNNQSFSGPVNSSTSGTYYVTVTSADGCTSTASTVLSLYSMPVVTCPANFDVCSDDSEFALSGATPVGGTYSGTGVSGGNFNPVSAGLGSHTITYTYANGPCENSCTFSILVEDCCPGINITGNTIICIGETTTLTPDPNMPHASQPWVSSNTAVATVNNSGVVTGVADGTTTITYKDVNGCTEDVVVVVSSNIEPTFSFDTEYCLNETPDALPSASNSGVNGTWDISTITTSVVGTQDYTFTPADVGCYIPTTITVTVHDNIEPTFSFETDYCLNDVPDALPTTSDDLINGVWSPSPIATSTVGTQDYIFTPTDVGCYIPTTVVVIVGDNTEPTFSFETEYCLNDIPDALPSVSNNGISGTWNMSPINTSSVGTQDYVFTPSSSGCFVPTTITVIVNDNIVPDFSFETEYCLNETPDALPSASNSGVNGTWDISTITTSVVGTQDYIFTPSDAGCYLPATITVTINDNITPTFSFDTEYCLDATAGTLPGTSNNGYTGTWSPSTIGTTTAGSDVYTFTPTAGLCATTTSVDIEIVEIELNVSMTGSACYGEDGSFSFTASGGSGSYSYTVNGSSATSPYSASAGTYTVVVSDGTCSTSQSITLTQAELLEAYYTKTNVTCNGGNNGSIDVTVEGGTTPYSFAWNDGNVTTEDRTGLVSGTYSVVVTDANGCSTSINNIAIIQPSAVNVIGVISHVACFNGSTGGIVTTTIGGNTGGYTYSWSSSQQTANIIGVIAGTYTVTATDSQGCTGTASFVITQPDAISISSQLSHPICNAQTNGGVVLTVSGGSPNYTYQWNPAGIGGSGTQNLSGVGAGTYNVTVTDSHSCTSTATYTITEPTAISVSETIVNTTCDLPNGSISINTSGGTPQYTYQWDAAAQDATTPVVSNLNNQWYTVTVSDANQCTVVDTISVERDIPPTLSLVEQINETCSDTNAVITVEVIDGNPVFTYEWSIDLGHNSPTISDIPAGDHLVVVTDADGCVDSLTIVITNHEAQEVGVAAISPAHCDQSDGGASLDVIGGSGTYTYDWGTSPPRTSSHETELPGGQYTVTVNDGVCDVEVIVDVPNMPGPTVNASANPNEVSVSKALIRFDDGSEGATSWNWDFDNGQYSIDQRPNFKYEMPGTYVVVITVSDDYGCTASDTVTVIVLEELVVWIPNAFTPDSDGLNEFFGPEASGMSLDGYEMIIYDRWGKQAFISNDYYHRWDGKINGQKVTMNGVFVYRIVIYDTLGKDFIFTGRVSLIFGLE